MIEEKKQRILIVDDTPSNIKMLGELLRDDYKIMVAKNGEKALNIARLEVVPDLILLDIMMPDMDGYEVCKRLKSDVHTQEIPVIFISAKSEVVDEMRALEMGAVDYIIKPFSMPIVKARIKTHLMLRETMEREQDQREQLHAIISHAMDGIIHIDMQGIIQSFNPAAEKMFGYQAAEVLGQNINMLMPEPNRSQHDGHLKRYHETGETHIIGTEREVVALCKDGSAFPLALHINTMILRGEPHFIGMVSDLTERKETEARIIQLAHFDTLTGLANRNMFLDHLQQMLAKSRRSRVGFCLFFLDLDGFKAINDTLGHAGGDAVLKRVAERLNSCVREVDTVARLGGDEFTLILSDITQQEQAATVANKIIDTLGEAMMISGKECYIGASIGITIHTANDDKSTDALIQYADDAMYQAKKSGKNCYRFHQE